MHCPSCANESGLDQKFCRKCGFNLEPISKLILGANDDETKLDKVERDKLLMRRMVRWMMRGMLIMLIGIVMIVVSKQYSVTLFQLLPLALLGNLITLGGVSVLMYGLLDTMRGGGLKKRKPKASEASMPDEIEPASTTKELEGRLPIPLGSVTERTTQLIAVDPDQRS